MKRLGLCLLSVTVLGLTMATATAIRAENWKPSPGEAKTFYDADFMRVDETSGLVLVRIAEGRPNGPYKGWPASKGPIMVFAVDCAADKWVDLGLDFTGDQGLPKGWRTGEKIEDAKAAVGGAARVACEGRDGLQKASTP